MIEHSPSIAKLVVALHAAQRDLTGVKRDSTNPHFRNRYASLEAVIEAARPPLNDAGLVFTQAPGQIVNGAVEITTMLMHGSGEWMRSTLHVPLAKTDPQGVGSAITYGCRYALMATLGLPPVDDDAEAAVGRGSNAKPNGKAEPINAEQLKQIQTLIVETGADIQKFCRYLGVEGLPAIPASKFQAATDALEAKRAKS